jgi:hypothetical protein
MAVSFANMLNEQYLNLIKSSQHRADPVEARLNALNTAPQITATTAPNLSQAPVNPVLSQQQYHAINRLSNKTNSSSSTTNNILNNLNNLKNNIPRSSNPVLSQLMHDNPVPQGNPYLYHVQSQQPKSTNPVYGQSYFNQSRPDNYPRNVAHLAQTHLAQVNAQTYNNQLRPVSLPRRPTNPNVSSANPNQNTQDNSQIS